MPRLLAISLVLLMASAVRSQVPTPTAVLDGEKLFGKAAIDRVNTLAAEIKEAFGIQFVLETRKTPPGVDPVQFQKMRTKDKFKTLREAAQNRADDLGVNGLFVMYTSDQKHVAVVGWPVGRELELGASSHKRNEMRKYLSDNLAKNPDDALVRAVETYKQALGERRFESPMDALRALAVVGALLGAWALLWFVRRRIAGKAEAPPIYRPAMLGSLFGVPAGFWIHDQLFQAERPGPVAALMGLVEAEPPSEAIKPAAQAIQTPVAVPPASEEQP